MNAMSMHANERSEQVGPSHNHLFRRSQAQDMVVFESFELLLVEVLEGVGFRFHDHKRDTLFDVIEKIFLVSAQNRKIIADEQDKKWKQKTRVMKGLRHNFNSIWQKHPPTGDPSRSLPIRIGADFNDDLDISERELVLLAGNVVEEEVAWKSGRFV